MLFQRLGRQEDFGGLDIERGQSPLLAESKTWISRTPFLPTRHPKATRAGVSKLDAQGLQIGSPEHDLRRLLALEWLPEPMMVEPVAGTRLNGRKCRSVLFCEDERRYSFEQTRPRIEARYKC